MTRAALSDALPDLAALRIAVFRDRPYLYDGDPNYETDYLRAHANSAGALVVGAFDGAALVGAATAAPTEDHAAAFAVPFQAAGHDLAQILYSGESVLLPAYCGRGVGHAFFDARGAHGRALGRRLICFSAVVRDPADPRRPANYAPLDGLWRKRGYPPQDGARASYRWREICDAKESAHAMQYWARRL